MAQGWRRSTNETLATLQDVVAIESVNPELPGGSRGEVEMVEYLCAFFAGCGIPFVTTDVLDGRANVVATLVGADPSRTLMFECHMDTASALRMTIPAFEPHIRDGRLYGRGACDTKAGGVAMKRIRESGAQPRATIQYAGAVDEERFYRGALRLAASTGADAVIVSEPTELAVVRAHKGIARFRILVTGRAAHSSKPHLGINAISQMARIVRDVERDVPTTYRGLDHPLTGGPTLSIGVISGGTQVNFVPDQCAIEIDRRVIPGERPIDTLAAFQAVIDRAKSDDPDLDAVLEEPYLMDESMETSEHAEIVLVAAGACRAVLGNATVTGVPYGTDGSKFAARGIPTIVLGPGNIDQAHTADEWVSCEQVERAVDIFERIMLEF